MVGKISSLETAPEVIIGTPIYRRGAFILDKFLSNQKEIQNRYPTSSLVFACNEPDFAGELKQRIQAYDLKGEVIAYETNKPSYAKNWVWNVACGREAIRQYMLSQTKANYLLFLDADMTSDPSIIEIMLRKIQGNDVVFSGYAVRTVSLTCLGIGCSLLTRDILEKLRFRCYEFKNGHVIDEGEVLEMDLFSHHAKVNRGFFVSTKHYRNAQEYAAIEPQPVSWFRKMTNNLLVRYMLIRGGILLRHDILGKLQLVLYRARHRTNVNNLG